MTDKTNKRFEEMADTLYGLLELAETDQENIKASIEGMEQAKQNLIERVDSCVQENVRSALEKHSSVFQSMAIETASASEKVNKATKWLFLKTLIVSCLVSGSIAAGVTFVYVPSVKEINERRIELYRLETQIKDNDADITKCRDNQGRLRSCVKINPEMSDENFGEGYRVLYGH